MEARKTERLRFLSQAERTKNRLAVPILLGVEALCLLVGQVVLLPTARHAASTFAVCARVFVPRVAWVIDPSSPARGSRP